MIAYQCRGFITVPAIKYSHLPFFLGNIYTYHTKIDNIKMNEGREYLKIIDGYLDICLLQYLIDFLNACWSIANL